MSEITNENRNKLISNDVSNFMNRPGLPGTVKKPRVRSEKQKENDLKLSQRLREYHSKKASAKNNEILSYIDETRERDIITAVEVIEELNEIEQLIQIKDEFDEAVPIMITKPRRGRPKKISHKVDEYIKACHPGIDEDARTV